MSFETCVTVNSLAVSCEDVLGSLYSIRAAPHGPVIVSWRRPTRSIVILAASKVSLSHCPLTWMTSVKSMAWSDIVGSLTHAPTLSANNITSKWWPAWLADSDGTWCGLDADECVAVVVVGVNIEMWIQRTKSSWWSMELDLYKNTISSLMER